MQAHVSSAVLRELLGSVQSCASGVASVRGGVESFIGQHMAEARDIVETLRQQEYDALFDEKWKEDIYKNTCVMNGGEFPDCEREFDQNQPGYYTDEGRDWRKAKAKRKKIQEKREKAEKLLAKMELEISSYYFFTGGDGQMSRILDDFSPNTTHRLLALLEKVERYEIMGAAVVDIGNSNSSSPRLADAQSMASRFRAGSQRIREVAQEHGLQLCPDCGVWPCTCGMEERQRIMSRFRGNGR